MGALPLLSNVPNDNPIKVPPVVLSVRKAGGKKWIRLVRGTGNPRECERSCTDLFKLNLDVRMTEAGVPTVLLVHVEPTEVEL